MAKIRHLAIATNNPRETADFYKSAFEFEEVGLCDNDLAKGVFLSDGTLSLAILKFHTDQLGRGLDYQGLHHFGILVKDEEATRKTLEGLGHGVFMDRPAGTEESGNFFEVKFKDPDGVLFDIAASPWAGAEGWSE